MLNKKSQVWIETVIYTLIGMSLIGVVLGVVKPAIQEKRDSLSVKQSVELLDSVDSSVEEVRRLGTGNARPLSIKISEGKMVINGENESIGIFIENSMYKYSEPNIRVNVGGNVKAITTARGKNWDINLTIDYTDRVNITYKGKGAIYTMQKASIPYDLFVRNVGPVNNLMQIDFY